MHTPGTYMPRKQTKLLSFQYPSYACGVDSSNTRQKTEYMGSANAIQR
jgi:hypothetical protein